MQTTAFRALSACFCSGNCRVKNYYLLATDPHLIIGPKCPVAKLVNETSYMAQLADTKKKHILIVDDDITALDIVSYLFEEKGYNVERCADGHSAIESIRENNPDLLLVDLLMPQINGVDTVKRIRELGHGEIPIIAFTAVDEPELHKDAIDAGCNDLLTKPCSAEKLIRHIKKFLPDL